MKAWYFAQPDETLGYGDDRQVEVGITHKVAETPELCRRGLHGSKRIMDALTYSKSPIVYRVEIEGQIDEGADKLCGQSRTYLKRYDIEDILFVVSRKFAYRNIYKIEPYVTKEDYQVIIRWLETGDIKIRSAARSAADSAARYAAGSARSAARSAAWCAAWSEADSAARYAADSAAWYAADSARSAARYAARYAADSARSEADSAEKDYQETLLLEMIEEKYGEIDD